MPEPECLVRFDGRVYTLTVETLHHRFFYGGGDRLHVHPSYHFILVSRGSCMMHVKGHVSVRADRNTLIFLNPLIAHDFTGDERDGAEHVCLIWRFHDENGTPAIFPLQKLLEPELEHYADFTLVPLNEFDAGNFLQKQQAAELAFRNREAGTASFRLFELFFLGLNLLPAGKARKEPLDNAGRIVAQIERCVEQNFMRREFGIPELAQSVGLHPNYLNAVFRSVRGLTLGGYITQKRLQLARMMLESTAYNLSEIALMCGFADLSYFSRLFRKHCGEPPGSFRNRKRSG